jgi:NB-ARC domain
MLTFVNRETELELVSAAFEALVSTDRLLRTPIIEVYGVSGIGKTSFLKQIVLQCHEKNIPYIWVDISQSISNFSHEIVSQVEKYRAFFPSPVQNDTEPIQLAVTATQTLLQQGPVVMFLDTVDMARPEMLNNVETLLKDLADNEKLFIVLASKRILSFQGARSVARKLTTLQLSLLDKASCERYLISVEKQIEPAVRDLIFEWTRGYPAAMNVMVQAVNSGLDPRQEANRSIILSMLMADVIHQQVLANVTQEKLPWYQSALQLLSPPRRFNLMIMEDLIKQFAPQLQRESSFAYLGLPKEINEATDVLSWSVSRAGFSVDTPVRNLFLLILRFEQPERYFAIHAFLAEVNERLATEVTGFDRIRYLKECLYHQACNTASPDQSNLLRETMQLIGMMSPELYLQFWEEFSQDDELKEALDSHLEAIQSIIHQKLAAINRQFAEESSGADRIHFLQEQFLHLISDHNLLPVVLKDTLQNVIDNETPEISFRLFEELTAQDDRFKELLGEDFATLSSTIKQNYEAEG